jgi:hypothetical protein
MAYTNVAGGKQQTLPAVAIIPDSSYYHRQALSASSFFIYARDMTPQARILLSV